MPVARQALPPQASMKDFKRREGAPRSAAMILLAVGSLLACRPAPTAPEPTSPSPDAGGGGSSRGGGGSGGGAPAKDAAATTPPPIVDGKAPEADTNTTPPRPDAGVEAPPADEGKPMLIAAAGDIAAAMGGDEKTTATLLHKVHAETPLTAILMLGDGAYRFAGLAEYKRLYEPTWGVPAFKAITYPIPGNHEYLNTTTGQGYFDYWNGVGQMNGKAGERGKGYYSFDLGSWHVVALNSNDDCKHVACGEGSAQLAWLRADLAAHPAPCTLGMVHAPRYQSGTHRGDTPALQAAWAAMYDAGVDVVLAAHEHNYQQFAPMDKAGKLDSEKGIRSFVVGTGGGRDFRAVFTTAHMATEEKRIVNQSGVMFMTLEPRGYTFRWLHSDGRVGAMGSGVCH